MPQMQVPPLSLAPYPTLASASPNTPPHTAAAVPESKETTAPTEPTPSTILNPLTEQLDALATALEQHLSQIHTTLLSMWQRLRAPDTDTPQTIVIAGTRHKHATVADPALRERIGSLLWFTYRCGFAPIPRAADGPGPLAFFALMLANPLLGQWLPQTLENRAFFLDVGWGCMIRTSQALLANALRHTAACLAGELLPLFADSYESPFLLHNFIQVAAELPLQVKPGQWFGPSAASLLIKRLCERARKGRKVQGPLQLSVVTSESSDLYEDVLCGLMDRRQAPVLVLLPIRLGIDNVNAYYHESLLRLFDAEQCVGIAGGKPASSYFFFGAREDAHLLYLDPHQLQPVLDSLETYRTAECKTLPIDALDPLMLIGFVLRHRADLEAMKATLAGSKIVHFHPCKARPQDDFVRVSMPDLDDTEDFVNVSDQVSFELELDMLELALGLPSEVPLEVPLEIPLATALAVNILDGVLEPKGSSMESGDPPNGLAPQNQRTLLDTIAKYDMVECPSGSSC